MKYWTHLILVIVAGFLLSQYLPWWRIAFLAIATSFLLKHKIGLSIMFGFLAGFILWAGYALYIDAENQGIFSAKVGALFGGISTALLIAITGFIGGLIVALGSAVGACIREIVPNYLTE